MGQVPQAERPLAQPALPQNGEGLVHPGVPRLAEALPVELVAFEQITRQQGQGVDQQHEGGLVFQGQKDAVAAALAALEGVVPHRAGAGPADVVAAGGRAEHALVAGVVGPPAQVHVLEIGKEVLVKDADLIEDALAVERRPAAGREDALLLCVAAGKAAVAGLAGKAHPGDIVPGVVGQLPLKVADHQALDREDALVAVGGADQLFQPVGFGKSVVVEQDHILAVGQGNALVHRVGKAGVLPVFDQGEVGPAAVAAGLLEALVGGTVIHHDEVEVLFGLGVDRLDGVFQPALAVDIGNDDGCFHSRSCLRLLVTLAVVYHILPQKNSPPSVACATFQGGPISACIRRSEILPPWYPPFRQNEALNRALGPRGLAHSQRSISLYVSRPYAHVVRAGLFTISSFCGLQRGV